jgi:uncharacterized membrane protein
MNKDIKNILIILILFLIIDVPVLFIINKDMYAKQFLRINQGEMNINNRTYISATISYILLAVGLYMFVLRNNNDNMILQKSFLFGIIIYGIYNATNLATINEFGIKESIVDTLWGGIICTIITFLMKIQFTIC